MIYILTLAAVCLLAGLFAEGREWFWFWADVSVAAGSVILLIQFMGGLIA